MVIEWRRTILLAGHETSATTLCWVLLELARHPEVQQRLRQEIRDTEQAIRARGGSDFTASDLDNMSYLHAVIKVSEVSDKVISDAGFLTIHVCGRNL
jgi:hypothetical protein